MTENIYSLLMRKYIFGFTTEEEEDLLFAWLDKDEGHYNYLTWFSAYLQLADDPDAKKALTRVRPEDTQFIMSDDELDALLSSWLFRKWTA